MCSVNKISSSHSASSSESHTYSNYRNSSRTVFTISRQSRRTSISPPLPRCGIRYHWGWYFFRSLWDLMVAMHSLQFWPESSEIPSITDRLPTKGKCGRWKSEICPVEYVEPMLRRSVKIQLVIIGIHEDSRSGSDRWRSD